MSWSQTQSESEIGHQPSRVRAEVDVDRFEGITSWVLSSSRCQRLTRGQKLTVTASMRLESMTWLSIPTADALYVPVVEAVWK